MHPAYLAFGAAILWGLYYVLTARALADVPPLVVLFVIDVVMMVMGAVALYVWPIDFNLHKLASGPALNTLLLTGVVAFAANLFIIASLGKMNPTTAALIEISYPLFIAMFAWLLFRENHMSFGNMAGGALILAGVAVISIFGSGDEHALYSQDHPPPAQAEAPVFREAVQGFLGLEPIMTVRVCIPETVRILRPTDGLLEIYRA